MFYGFVFPLLDPCKLLLNLPNYRVTRDSRINILTCGVCHFIFVYDPNPETENVQLLPRPGTLERLIVKRVNFEL